MLCNFLKVFEDFVYNCVYTGVSNKISDFQNRFPNKRSTVTNLVSIRQYIMEAEYDNKQVDAIYTSFPKAFDRANQTILLSKSGLSALPMIPNISSNLT